LLSPLALSAADPSDSEPAEGQASRAAASFIRSDSLELPGLTACHQCEWRPKPHQMAAEQCGSDTEGKPRLAEFECGFSEDCQRVCNFVRCLNP
jgi:hypothetical protein